MRKFSMRKFSLIRASLLFSMGLTSSIISSIPIAIPGMLGAKIPRANREQTHRQKGFFEKFFGDRERRGGSRSPFCSIVPSPNLGSILWNNMPLLVWKTKRGVTVKKIAIVNFDTEETIWSEDNIDPAQQFLVYTGMPLASGEYQYKVVYELNQKEFPTEIDFDIMAEGDRDRMARELQQRASQNPNLSPEELALQRADVFADAKLWVDGLQELFALQNPSPILVGELQKLRNSLCQD
ncbi:MAG: hypothetical protein J7647_03730 [Cyanobacteria bacterium SBLK]|nr:hypothetical protein [Cyanobacteria bacterium SBLK]